MLNDEEKMQIAVEVLPLAIQALHNAKRFLRCELNGTWWKLPDNIIQAVLTDCCIVLEMLYGLGLFPIGGKEEFIHINVDEKEKIFEKFNWIKCQQSEKLNEMAKYEIAEKFKDYKKDFETWGQKKIEEECLKFKTRVIDKFQSLLDKFQKSLKFINEIARLSDHFKMLCHRLDKLYKTYPSNETVKQLYYRTLPEILQIYKENQITSTNLNLFDEIKKSCEKAKQDIESL